MRPSDTRKLLAKTDAGAAPGTHTGSLSPRTGIVSTWGAMQVVTQWVNTGDPARTEPEGFYRTTVDVGNAPAMTRNWQDDAKFAADMHQRISLMLGMGLPPRVIDDLMSK